MIVILQCYAGLRLCSYCLSCKLRRMSKVELRSTTYCGIFAANILFSIMIIICEKSNSLVYILSLLSRTGNFNSISSQF